MLLEFIAGIIGQLVVDKQENVLPDPFALHSCTPASGKAFPEIASQKLIAYLPARRAASG
jgi:hypothetical protein